MGLHKAGHEWNDLACIHTLNGKGLKNTRRSAEDAGLSFRGTFKMRKRKVYRKEGREEKKTLRWAISVITWEASPSGGISPVSWGQPEKVTERKGDLPKRPRSLVTQPERALQLLNRGNAPRRPEEAGDAVSLGGCLRNPDWLSCSLPPWY